MNNKYGTEGALDVYVKSAALLRNDHILRLKKEALSKYNIYCVLAAERPIIKNVNINKNIFEFDIRQNMNIFKNRFDIDEFFKSFDNNKIIYTEDEICINLTEEDLNFNKSKNMQGFESFFEFSTFKKIKYQDPKFLAKLHLSADYYWLNNSLKNIKKMEFDLLYVGQSSAMFKRIHGHETIQKIQADYMYKYRNKNIYILLLEIDTQIVMGMDGISDKTTNKINIKHINDLTEDIFSSPFNQIVNITEAMLIYHFKPFYNDKLKNNFPNRKHQSYQHYFDLDYESIFFEFYPGLSDFGTYEDFPMIKISTEKNSLSNVITQGNIMYKLHNDKIRKSIFDIFKD